VAFGKRGIYKTPEQLRLMVPPGLATAASLAAVRAAIAPGVTTAQLDKIAEKTIRDLGGQPNFALVPGYRHTICASVNDAVVHGIPDDRPLEPGDIVSIDSGAEIAGWNGDSAITVVIPDPARPELVAERQRLADAGEYALWAGIAALVGARHLNDIGAVIEDAILGRGEFGILEDYIGHGIGRSMHEDPPVFNYAVKHKGPAVKPGLTVAIEPMITLGTNETRVLDDDWTVVTTDGSAGAHWEHSVAVHADGIWVLTAEDGGAAGLAAFGVAPTPLA
jgi:methionyl aminopeptidase